MNKKLVVEIVNEVMNSNFIKEIYNSKCLSEKEKDQQDYMAKLFNLTVTYFQIDQDITKYKNFLLNYLENFRGSEPSIDKMFFVETINEMLHLNEGQIAEILKHGLAIHFTSTSVAEKIKNTGKMMGLGGMFEQEDLKIIRYANNTQAENLRLQNKEINFENILTTGFGYKDGICSSNTTVGFYMYRTPEALTFLFAGNYFSANYKSAMDHIENCISTLTEEEKTLVRDRMRSIWNKCSGADNSKRTAILIDRDKIEYEKVYYYGNDGKVSETQEIRSYANGNLNAINEVENATIVNEISSSDLYFVNVPTVSEMNSYQSKHVMNGELKI